MIRSLKMEPEEEVTYPYLGLGSSEKIVVLFTAYGTGTCVWVEPGFDFKVGDYSKTWTEDNFEHFDGTIELVNL